MKIYIDEENVQVGGACKAACPKGLRVYSIEEKKVKRSVL